MSISGSCLPEPVKYPRKPLIALPDRPYGPICKARSYPTSVNERTTVVIISGMNFCNFGVVPSKLSEIRYDGWYRNHICSVRLPTVFRYFEGTTPKSDLFQFLCMASRTNQKLIIAETDDRNYGYYF